MDTVNPPFDSAAGDLIRSSDDPLPAPRSDADSDVSEDLLGPDGKSSNYTAPEDSATDVYADVMREVPLLKPEEEEKLGKTIHSSRLKMVRALSNIPAASILAARRFGEVERGERPRTDVFFAPVQSPSAEPNRETNKPDSDSESTEPHTAGARDQASRWSWRDNGRALLERVGEWQSRRDDKGALKRLAEAFRKLQPGFVVLREALEHCDSLDRRVSKVESLNQAFYADVMAEAEDSDRLKQPSSEKARASARVELAKIEREAGTDLTTLRACCRAASRAYTDYKHARARMVNANLRLAHYLAYRLRGNGVPVEDLVQEAIIGLMRAVDRFDYRRGHKFSTYAYHWIRQTTTLAIAESSRTVRIAPHMHDRMRRLRKLAGDLEQNLGRGATSGELIEASELTPAQVRHAISAARVPASFDAPLSGLEDSTLHTLIRDPNQTDPSELSDQAKIGDRVARLLDGLPQRESFILRLRHGIGVREPYTLEEIGARLGITRERTRQLESLALAKLRERMSELHAIED